MASRNRSSAGGGTGAPTGSPTGSGTGSSTGHGTGSAAGEPLSADAERDLDDLEPHIARTRAEYSDHVLVYAADGDGRSVGGSRLGPLSLDPIETLAERVIDEWGGPRVYWLRIRRPDGTVALWARIRQRAYRAGRSRAPDPLPAPVSAVSGHLASPAAAPSPDPLALLERLQGLGLVAAPGAHAAPAAPERPQTIAQQVNELTSSVGALERLGLVSRVQPGGAPAGGSIVMDLIKELKEPAANLFGQLFGAVEMLGASRKADASAREAEARAHEAIARAREAEAKRVATPPETPAAPIGGAAAPKKGAKNG